MLATRNNAVVLRRTDSAGFRELHPILCRCLPDRGDELVQAGLSLSRHGSNPSLKHTSTCLACRSICCPAITPTVPGTAYRSHLERRHRHGVDREFRDEPRSAVHKTSRLPPAPIKRSVRRNPVPLPSSSRQQRAIRPWTSERSGAHRPATGRQRRATVVTTRTCDPTSRASSTSPSIVNEAMCRGSLRFEMSTHRQNGLLTCQARSRARNSEPSDR